MSGLTTHILNVAEGVPASGVKIVLLKLVKGEWTECTTTCTNLDGRVDKPLIAQEQLNAGTYELQFSIGDYFNEKKFLDIVVVRFNVENAGQSYHVPLLVTPWSYQVYRGS